MEKQKQNLLKIMIIIQKVIKLINNNSLEIFLDHFYSKYMLFCKSKKFYSKNKNAIKNKFMIK